jgi:hypothetical protein
MADDRERRARVPIVRGPKCQGTNRMADLG